MGSLYTSCPFLLFFFPRNWWGGPFGFLTPASFLNRLHPSICIVFRRGLKTGAYPPDWTLPAQQGVTLETNG